jgi:hypothetical protein
VATAASAIEPEVVEKPKDESNTTATANYAAPAQKAPSAPRLAKANERAAKSARAKALTAPAKKAPAKKSASKPPGRKAEKSSQKKSAKKAAKNAAPTAERLGYGLRGPRKSRSLPTGWACPWRPRSSTSVESAPNLRPRSARSARRCCRPLHIQGRNYGLRDGVEQGMLDLLVELSNTTVARLVCSAGA